MTRIISHDSKNPDCPFTQACLNADQSAALYTKDVTSRHEFFAEVDEIVSILVDYAASDKVNIPMLSDASVRVRDVRMFAFVVGHSEGLTQRLYGFSPSALNYVAALCRARDGVISRRVSSALGSIRGGGLISITVVAFGLASLLNVLRTWFPTISAFWFLAAFVLSLYGVFYALSGVISGAHSTSRLLWYADLLEAVAKAQISGAFADKVESGEAIPVSG